MNKKLLVAVGKLVAFGVLTLGGIVALKPAGRAPPTAKQQRLFKLLESAPQQKFEPPSVNTLARHWAFQPTKDGNAGVLYVKALRAHFAEPGLKAAADAWLQAGGPLPPAVAGSGPVKLLEQAIQYRDCSITGDQILLKSMRSLDKTVALPADLFFQYAAVLIQKGADFAAAGKPQFEKLYVQATVRMGLHLTADPSPAAQVMGMAIVVNAGREYARLAQAGGDAAASGAVDKAIAELAAGYPKERYEDILLLASDAQGLKILGLWLNQPEYQRVYGFWTVLAGLTQWSDDEAKNGPLDDRRRFLEDAMAALGTQPAGRLAKLAVTDLGEAIKEWRETPPLERDAFVKKLRALPVTTLDPAVSRLYGAPLQLEPPPAEPAKTAG